MAATAISMLPWRIPFEQPVEKGKPVHAGHLVIDQGRVGRFGLKARQCLGTRGGGDEPIAVPAEQTFQGGRHLGVVVHQQEGENIGGKIHEAS